MSKRPPARAPRMRWTARLLALAGGIIVAAGAQPTSPAKATTDGGLEVQLVVREPLELVEHVWEQGPGEVSLTGRLVVKVTNRGTVQVTLRDLEAQGVVFTEVSSGKLYPVVHPCACVRDATEGPKEGATLQPGATTTIRVEEWGCGGGAWRSPPPGRYTLDYRVLPMPTTTTPPAAPHDRSPPRLVEACRRDMAQRSFWKQATHSKPIELTLRKPKRRWVR